MGWSRIGGRLIQPPGQAVGHDILEKEPLMDNRFEVTVGAGTMMSGSAAAVRFPHRWTPGGVTVEGDFTGGHLLHLAAAGCVLNDLYREAATLGIELTGARVTAAAGSAPQAGNQRASAIRSRSAPMLPPIRSRTCSKWSTKWPRFPGPYEPELTSGGSAEQAPQAPAAVGRTRDAGRTPLAEECVR